ncbi:hypothetical protein D3C76_629860 [compost metagenome]
MHPSAALAGVAGQHHGTAPWHHLPGGVVHLDVGAQVAGIQADPVDPIGLRVRHHGKAVGAGLRAAVTADLDPCNTGNFSQGEGFTHRLAKVDAAGMGDDGTGQVEVLRVVATSLAVADTDIGNAGAGGDVG